MIDIKFQLIIDEELGTASLLKNFEIKSWEIVIGEVSIEVPKGMGIRYSKKKVSFVNSDRFPIIVTTN